MTRPTGGGQPPPFPEKKAAWRIVITVAALLVCLMIGTGVVLNGVVFGILMFVAVYVIVTRLPGADQAVRKAGGWIDILVTVGTFFLLGGSVTAIVAAATTGCLFTIVITARRMKGPRGWVDSILESAERKLREYAEEPRPGDRDRDPRGDSDS